jgi:hypothetical protein
MAIHSRDESVALTSEQIRLRITDHDIFSYYCEPYRKPGLKFSSELRKDPKPSARVDLIGDKLRYIDYGEPLHRFDSIGYVQ